MPLRIEKFKNQITGEEIEFPVYAVGEAVKIPGGPFGDDYICTDATYDYDERKTVGKLSYCPVCNVMSDMQPWMGWFTCEGDGRHVAFLATKQMFVPAPPDICVYGGLV